MNYKKKARSIIALGVNLLFFGVFIGMYLATILANIVFILISIISLFISLPLFYVGGIVGDMGKDSDFLFDHPKLFATSMIGIGVTGLIFLIWSLLEFFFFVRIDFAIGIIYFTFLLFFIDGVTLYARKNYLKKKEQSNN